MEMLWNQLDLQRPPTTTWNDTPNNFDSKIFLKTINKIYNELTSQDVLNQEAAVLSRLIYRMKRKFRHDKGLKNMEKVNRALLNYLHLSLENEYKYLIDNTIVTNNLVTLPTKQMLQYVLTRTQGFSKLMCRIEKVSMEAATFFKVRIQIGHAWTLSAVAYAVISRIWMLSRYMVKRCCIWYNKLFPCLSKLRLVGIDWLPQNYRLPSDLKNWLSVSWIDEPNQCLPLNEQSTDSIFSLIKHQNESDDETDLTIDIENNNNEETISINDTKNEEILIDNNDIGVPISRDFLNTDLSEPSKPLKKHKKLTIKNIKSEEDLNLLLSLDSYPGMDKLQWNIMKKTISKALLKISKIIKVKKRNILVNKTIKSLQQYVT